MIKKLRVKFIVVSILAVLVLLAVIVAAMNITNYNSVVREADEVLAILSENGGSFPQFGRKKEDKRFSDDSSSQNASDIEDSLDDYLDSFFDDEMTGDDSFDEWLFPPQGRDDFPGGFFGGGQMSAETPYESRFFSVLLDDNGTVLQTDTSRIIAVDETAASEYATEVYATGKVAGFTDSYRYVRCNEEEGVRIIFLDCGRRLSAFRNFMLISILTALGGCIAFFFVIFFASGRMTKPVAESYEKQKRFITDAGHEIKTPLTIIRADADILEMDLGENEWLEDIQRQTGRLASLTEDLIYLSRTEEQGSSLTMVEFPLSDVVEESASSFAALAKAENKRLTVSVRPMLSLKGDEKQISRLVGILLDNAFKYSPEGTEVSLQLEKHNKNIVLTVRNETSETVAKESLPLLFDRFYRTDASRSSKTGGHGIGLSMAKAIVLAHGGKIRAESEDGKSLQMIVTF